MEALQINTGYTPEEEMALHSEKLGAQRPTPLISLVPKRNSDNFVIDTSKWKMRDYRKWTEAAQSAQFAMINKLVLNVVKAWPYPYPINEEGLDEMTPQEWKQVVTEISNNAGSAFL